MSFTTIYCRGYYEACNTLCQNTNTNIYDVIDCRNTLNNLATSVFHLCSFSIPSIADLPRDLRCCLLPSSRCCGFYEMETSTTSPSTPSTPKSPPHTSGLNDNSQQPTTSKSITSCPKSPTIISASHKISISTQSTKITSPDTNTHQKQIIIKIDPQSNSQILPHISTGKIENNNIVTTVPNVDTVDNSILNNANSNSSNGNDSPKMNSIPRIVGTTKINSAPNSNPPSPKSSPKPTQIAKSSPNLNALTKPPTSPKPCLPKPALPANKPTTTLVINNKLTENNPSTIVSTPPVSAHATPPSTPLTISSGTISSSSTSLSSISVTNSPRPALQSKREMFFKSEGSGGTGGGTAPVAPPSSAPPAPPVTAPSNAPPPPPNNNNANTNGTTTASATITTTSTTSVASIKELLTTKERKDNKDEENKENKMAKETIKERKPREVDGYVGFANLPNQVYRKAVKRGFEFSLMVVGESGLGKSTMINSMFLSDIYSADHPGPSHRVKKTVQVETTKVLLKENGVNLMLTVVDTPGFGDAVDNSDCWQPVIDYIETKYEEYLNAESRVNRTLVNDSRIHCCLYFIAPSGHGLKPLDIEFMRRLHDKVNIIPVISKADTLTPDECQHLKRQILNEIAQHKIKIYEFPDDDNDPSTTKLKQRVPFAVVGSNATIEIDGRKIRGRKYPWGIVEVENMEHCDFIPLRNMMIRTHMQDLKDVTNNVHYENFRCRKLAGIGGVDGKVKASNKNPLAQMEEEKKEHSNRMKKMEAEMEQVFEMKVKEKMNKLSDLESDLKKRNESMKKKLESEFKQLEDEREHFEQEKKSWEHATGCSLEDLRRKHLESSSREHMDQKEKPKKKKGGLF